MGRTNTNSYVLTFDMPIILEVKIGYNIDKVENYILKISDVITVCNNDTKMSPIKINNTKQITNISNSPHQTQQNTHSPGAQERFPLKNPNKQQ